MCVCYFRQSHIKFQCEIITIFCAYEYYSIREEHFATAMVRLCKIEHIAWYSAHNGPFQRGSPSRYSMRRKKDGFDCMAKCSNENWGISNVIAPSLFHRYQVFVLNLMNDNEKKGNQLVY